MLRALIPASLTVAPLALAGLQRLLRTGGLSRVEAEGLPAASHSAFPAWAERLTGASFRPDNEVEVLCNGAETFPRLWSDLEGACRSIDMQIYFAETGAVADRTFAILEEKARAGVPVRCLYDPVGCRGLDRRYPARLRAAGGAAHRLRPLRWDDLDGINHRVHSRIVLIDGQVGYTGDFGISDRWLGDGHSAGSWRSTNARFRGPVLGEHAAAFATLWSEAFGELAVGAGFAAASRGASTGGGVRAALLHSTPGQGSTSAERVWALTLAAARESCWITSGYFAPTAEQVHLLRDAAQRGVDVRVLTASAHHTDIPPAYWAGRSRYRELLGAGVRIYEYSPSMMHAKSWVVDGTWCSVGALNLDNRSVALNDEVALMLHDAGSGARLEAIFGDDLRRAREVSPADLERDDWGARARTWGASHIHALL